MTITTFTDSSIQLGNILITNLYGEITYTTPENMLKVDVSSTGQMTRATNAMGLLRSIMFSVPTNSNADLLLKTIVDATFYLKKSTINLITTPLIITTKMVNEDGVLGYQVFNFKQFGIESHKFASDKIFDTKGDTQISLRSYSLTSVMPFAINDAKFIPE